MKNIIACLIFSCIILSCGEEKNAKTKSDFEGNSEYSSNQPLESINKASWMEEENVDTIITYHKFLGGQVNAKHIYFAWWIKNGKVNGYSERDKTEFKGFEILFENIEEFKSENSLIKESSISHSQKETVKVLIDKDRYEINGLLINTKEYPNRSNFVNYIRGYVKEKE